MKTTASDKTTEQRIRDFAEACYNQNSTAELKAALAGKRADRADCAEWGLTAAQWREAIGRALIAQETAIN
jgi:hypothetical protein